MAINVLMNSVDTAHKKYQKSITDFSPSADNAHITEFVQGLNSLTSNTVTGIRKVEITDLLNPEEDTRLDRNLHLEDTNTSQTVTSINFASIGTMDNPQQEATVYFIKFDGSSDTVIPTFTRASDPTNLGMLVIDWYYVEGWELLMLRDTGTWNGGTITISVPGDTAYKPASVTLTITE